MRKYENFHGNIEISKIGFELRKIAKLGKDFKILTGYGSTCGLSKSRIAAIKSLSKMKNEGIIKGFLPGEVKFNILKENSPYYEDKINFSQRIKNDSDFGNDGIIFIFIE